jgi:hypothetical protein
MINLWTIQGAHAVVTLLSKDVQNAKMNGIAQENASLRCGSSIKHIVLSNVKSLKKYSKMKVK